MRPGSISSWRSTSAEAGAKVEQQPILAQYSAALSAIARQRPLVLILEDLHWVDSASSGLLFHLSREAAHSRMLILGTYRPDEVAVSRGEMAHPLAEMLSELKRRHGDIWLDLGELAEADGRRFVEAYLDTQPNRLGPAFREALFNRTGGHALFTVELVRETAGARAMCARMQMASGSKAPPSTGTSCQPGWRGRSRSAFSA